MCLPKGRRSPCYPVQYECFRQRTSCERTRHGCVFQRVEGVHVIQFSTNVLDSELPVNLRDMGVFPRVEGVHVIQFGTNVFDLPNKELSKVISKLSRIRIRRIQFLGTATKKTVDRT